MMMSLPAATFSVLLPDPPSRMLLPAPSVIIPVPVKLGLVVVTLASTPLA